jgi:hypothetical protein
VARISGHPRRRSKRDIRSAIPDRTFTIRDLAGIVEAHPAAAGKAVAKGVQEGWLVDPGEDPDHLPGPGRGRAPRVYRKVVEVS